VASSRAGTILKRGFAKRCPVCGQGHLFHRWLQMVSNCPRCGYRFARAPGQWLGSWFLNICLAQMVAVIFLIVAVAVAWPEPVNLWIVGAGLAATIGWVFGFFPYSRTIWCAIDLAMKPLDFDDDVAPGYELEVELAELRKETGEAGPR
jgi:uncharacterized protein (DUF983 family)